MRTLPALLCLLPLAAFAADDESDEVAPAPETRIATIHLTPHTGYPDVWGTSVSLTALRPVELEAGLSLYSLHPESGGSYFVRGGIVRPIAATTPLEIQFLLGYRHQVGVQLPFTETCDECERSSGTIDLAVEKRWHGPRLWLTGRAMVGAAVAYDDVGDASGNVYPQGSASVGIAF